MNIYDMNVLSLKYEETETRLDLKHPFLYSCKKLCHVITRLQQVKWWSEIHKAQVPSKMAP